MDPRSEKMLDRLTLVGWIVLAANMLTCIVVVPLVILAVCPGVFELGGRIERYAIIAGFFIIGGAGFYASKWLLERFGITILRPEEHAPEHDERAI